MKFTEIEEIFGDEPHLPCVGLGDYVAWTQQTFPKCGHAKFGSNVYMDGDTPRCRMCRNMQALEKRQRKSHTRRGKYA